VVKPLQFDDDTPQTIGMHRLAAVSGLLADSKKLWAGVMMAEPSTASSVHHHGPLESVVYVVEGRSLLRWGHRLEHESELEAGDFLLIPPYLPHQEINPSPDKPALWIVVRSGPEAIVVDLAPDADGNYVTPGTGAKKRSTPARAVAHMLRGDSASPAGTKQLTGENIPGNRTRSISLILLAVSVVAFVGTVVSETWFWDVRRHWLALLPLVLLAVLGVLDLVWALHAHTARRLAVLDAYAEREIARSSAKAGNGML
jgi:uncharacterized RmlC-like cupin family protein